MTVICAGHVIYTQGLILRIENLNPLKGHGSIQNFVLIINNRLLF